MTQLIAALTYQFLAQFVSPFLGNAERSFPVLVLQTWIGSGPEEQPHAFALVLDDAVVQGGVSLPCLLVQAARVLYDKVNNVEGVSGFMGNRIV